LYHDLSDVDPHQWAMGLIPWYVNGTLAAAEATKLAAHLDACAQCRRDYQSQVRVFEAMQADTTLVFAADPSFRKLMARISSEEDAGPVAAQRPAPVMPISRAPLARGVPGGAARWLAAAVLLEGLGLGYGAWAWHSHGANADSAYVTLSSPAPSYRDSPRIRAVFRSGLSVGGLGAILHDTGAHIIDGPTDANVYTLGFARAGVTPAVVEQRVAVLRASADVLFAEPIGTGNGTAADDSR
jgi:hypothetical protein